MHHEWDAHETQNVQPLVQPPMVGETNPLLAGLNNSGAAPQGPAAQQGTVSVPPAEQAGMANAPLVIGNHVTPPTSTQVLHRLSLA